MYIYKVIIICCVKWLTLSDVDVTSESAYTKDEILSDVEFIKKLGLCSQFPLSINPCST